MTHWHRRLPNAHHHKDQALRAPARAQTVVVQLRFASLSLRAAAHVTLSSRPGTCIRAAASGQITHEYMYVMWHPPHVAHGYSQR